METQYLQALRYKLQRRIRRLNGADTNQFLFVLKQFWRYFDGVPILGAVAAELVARVPDWNDSVERAFQARTAMFGEDEAEGAAIGYGILRRFGSGDNPLNYYDLVGDGSTSEALNEFRALYLEPFYQYVDEHLDDRSFVLYSLIRYKHACEWFRRERLFNLWKSGTQHGERTLALDMYEYLHDRGVDFHIEPRSASGEADMVALQGSSSEPLIAEAKVFNPEGGRGKAYILKAFRQVYRYTCDYNQPIGYVVIFRTSERPISFALPSEAEPVPRVIRNHKTLFALEIDLYPHAETASKEHAPDPVIITEEEITGEPAEAAQAEPAGPGVSGPAQPGS
jgi:hypothetical protein